MSNNLNQKVQELPAGDFSRALKGDVKINVGPLLKHAWDITPRILLWMIGLFIGVVALSFVLQEIYAVFIPTYSTDLTPEQQAALIMESNMIGSMITVTLLNELIMAPFTALFIMVALANVANHKPNMALLRAGLAQWKSLVLLLLVKMVMILVSGVLLSWLFFLNTTLAMALLVGFGGYVQLSLILAIPLILDRRLGVKQAVFGSFIIVNKAMFPVLMLMILMFIIILISVIPLGLGLIFTLPMMANLIAVIYHALVGSTIAEHPALQTEGVR